MKLRTQLDALLDEYRQRLHDSLDGLTEEEARARLVPSKTTLLGLLKHVTYVEGVWFDEAVTGRSYKEIGIASTPTRSFTLTRTDTIASVRADHRARCEVSRANTAGLDLDDVVRGRGGRYVWQLYLQMLRELAHHMGHADILREQLLAARKGKSQSV
ncbi:DinB family protein [Virgisporangium ochraceum]|nr:DinB family protein [Virgisporangium ochraceum]